MFSKVKKVSLATSDGVHTQHLHFNERDGKGQRLTQTQALRVNVI